MLLTLARSKATSSASARLVPWTTLPSMQRLSPSGLMISPQSWPTVRSARSDDHSKNCGCCCEFTLAGYIWVQNFLFAIGLFGACLFHCCAAGEELAATAGRSSPGSRCRARAEQQNQRSPRALRRKDPKIHRRCHPASRVWRRRWRVCRRRLSFRRPIERSPRWPHRRKGRSSISLSISNRGQASPGFRPQRRARLVTQIPTSRNHWQLAIEEFDYNNLAAKLDVGTTGVAPTRGRTNSRIATGGGANVIPPGSRPAGSMRLSPRRDAD